MKAIFDTKKLIPFVVIPSFINILLIGLYFSGDGSAQQIIAPTIGQLPVDSWREFGLPEQIQNLYLLAIIAILATTALGRISLYDKLFFTVGALLFLFLFLEEIDYGIHFHRLFSGTPSSEVGIVNWHNQETSSGKQNVYHLKRAADLIMVIWFILAPMFSHKIGYRPLQQLIPSRGFIIGFLICIAFSRGAHLLHGWEWDVIDGNRGNLIGNLSEFRETCTYYFYLLYAMQLARSCYWRPNTTRYGPATHDQ